jgi:short subunit dehydrogenase-like uncharacterized protein
LSDVWIYGATGFTGELVARALKAQKIPFGMAGRNEDKLEALADELGGEVPTRRAELHQTEELNEVLGDAKVIVNCAGPFGKFGEPVVRAALRAGAHYLDTTGEQGFMRDTYEHYESAARKKNLCLVNACAFEVALGDWAAALAATALRADREPLDELVVAYAINDYHPTRGTRLSALDAAAAPGYVWTNDRWDPIEAATESRTVGFPAPFGTRQAVSFPSGEVISVPRHVRTRRVQAFFALPPGLASVLVPRVGRFAGFAARSRLGALLRKRATGAPPAPTPGQRGINDFAVSVTAQRGFDTAHVCVSGTDIYGTTADIIALAVNTLLTDGPRATGVCTPAEAFDARASLDALSVSVTASFPLS